MTSKRTKLSQKLGYKNVNSLYIWLPDSKYLEYQCVWRKVYYITPLSICQKVDGLMRTRGEKSTMYGERQRINGQNGEVLPHGILLYTLRIKNVMYSIGHVES